MSFTLALLLALAAAVFPGLSLLSGYIGGNAFPQPLSPPDEADALAKMKAGDTMARAQLIEHNLRLVAHVVKKFNNTSEEPDDLISIGTVGLIKAIDTFDADKNVRLATYAARCIENESAPPTPARGSFPITVPFSVSCATLGRNRSPLALEARS